MSGPRRSARNCSSRPAETRGAEAARTWDVETVLTWGRCKDRPLEAVCALRSDPRDPHLALPSNDAEALRDLAARLTPSQTRAAPDSPDDGGFETARHALARWAPDIRADLERQRFAVPTTDKALTRWLPRALLVLPDPTVSLWRDLAESERTAGNWDTALQTVAIAGADASTQIAVLEACPNGELPASWTKLMAAPFAADYATLAPHLGAGKPRERLGFWLEYLCTTNLSAMPTAWPPLAALFSNEDGALRARAFRVAIRADQPAFSSILAATDWRWRAGMEDEEAAYGSFLLAYAPEAARTDFSERVHPQALGLLAQEHPDYAGYLTGFAEHVRKELARVLSREGGTIRRSLFHSVKAWDQLKTSHGSDLCAWLEPLAAEDRPAPHHYFFVDEPFPLREALEASEPLQPGLHGRFVARCLTESRHGAMRFGQLYADACRIPGEGAEEARQLALEEANDDEKLLDLAFELQNSGQSEWLLAQIGRDLAGLSAGLIARGLTLAGFLDQTPEAEALWHGRLATAPTTGWLAAVHRRSRARYDQHCWASHWARRYRGAESDDEALAAHELMIASCDPRIYFEGVGRPMAEEMKTWSWRRQTHWRLRWPAVTAAAKACKDGYKKLFLTTDPPLERQRPRQH